MFGLGASEILVILVLVLLIFGPQKMPELARQMARMVGDLRRVADDVKQNFDDASREPPPSPHTPAQLTQASPSYHSGPTPDGQNPAPPVAPQPDITADTVPANPAHERTAAASTPHSPTHPLAQDVAVHPQEGVSSPATAAPTPAPTSNGMLS